MKFPLNVFDMLTWFLLRDLEAFKLVIKEYLHFTTDRLFYSDLLNDRLIIFLFERHLTLSQLKKYVISDMFRWWVFKNSYILQLVLLCSVFSPFSLPLNIQASHLALFFLRTREKKQQGLDFALDKSSSRNIFI